MDGLYFGLEAIQTNQNYKAFYGSPVFQANTQELNVFVGRGVSKYLGVELGCEYQPERNKNAQLDAARETLPGNIISVAANTATTSSSIQGIHPYLGLYNHFRYIFDDGSKLDFSAMLGVSAFHIQGNYHLETVNGQPVTAATRAAFSGSYDKTKLVPILKFAVMPVKKGHFTWRFSVLYRNLSSFRVRSSVTNNYELKLKDTIGVGLGIVYFR